MQRHFVTLQDLSPPAVARLLLYGPWGSRRLPHGPYSKDPYEAPQALRSQEEVT